MSLTSWTTQDKHTEHAQWQMHFVPVQPLPPIDLAGYWHTHAVGGEELHQAGIL